MSIIIRHKKGALQLSINAIVVLILAITMLGLGLGFMRNMFGSTTEQFTNIADEIQSQVIDKIESSGEKVTLLSKQVRIKKSEKKELFYGIKNVEDAGEFDILIECDSRMDDPNWSPSSEEIRFEYFRSASLEEGEVIVHKMQVNTGSTATSTYSCAIKVTLDGVKYEERPFFVAID